MPSSLPANLGGWIKAIVSSMGVNFTDKYIVDADVANLPLTATRESVEGMFCGELLRYACMATNTWPRQDMPSGNLRVGKLERLEGNTVTLDNMPKVATMEANDDIADITFSLDAGEVTFPGTNTNSDTSLSVSNPFVHTTDDARKAVISCLFEYGGRYFSMTSRGNPSSETGDLMSIATQFGTNIAARLYKQQLRLEQGIMHNVPSYLVQSPNDSVYANKVVLIGNGEWTSPVSGTVKVTLIGGGDGGQGGAGGTQVKAGELGGTPTEYDVSGGDGGSGGKIFVSELSVSVGQAITYSCGTGGLGGQGGFAQDVESDIVPTSGYQGSQGGATTFGQLTSNNGKVYPAGLMDIQSGSIYGAEGPDNGGTVESSYGSGGAGGISGSTGAYEVVKTTPTPGSAFFRPETITPATSGSPGMDGKPGCVILEW